MSIPMSLLALLDEGPRYGLQLKQQFDARTGDIWPLNVGQVYTTLARLERDGMVAASGDGTQRTYRITDRGRAQLTAWFEQPERDTTPARDELVLKLILAAARDPDRLAAVIRSERKAAVETLQEYTRLKRDPADATDLGWLLLLDSLIFKAESRIRWLDAARTRMSHQPVPSGAGADSAPSTPTDTSPGAAMAGHEPARQDTP
jgi:DNA-binding PadR family transcriptional regulator